ncbi:hypothetical protein HK098_002190 [Nowakowskiella sp. JEL0407]|nr:hypothetical protein HK098_002190 [Nowakowskiella sp. JEL0407]
MGNALCCNTTSDGPEDPYTLPHLPPFSIVRQPTPSIPHDIYHHRHADSSVTTIDLSRLDKTPDQTSKSIYSNSTLPSQELLKIPELAYNPITRHLWTNLPNASMESVAVSETTIRDSEFGYEVVPIEKFIAAVTDRGDLKVVDKNGFHSPCRDPGFELPEKLEESEYYKLQHLLYSHCFGRLFEMPIEEMLLNGKAKILDVGCGSGTWVKEVALKYPNAEIHGIDIAANFRDIEPTDNMKLFRADVLSRLPYADNTFDAVYQRLLSFSIPKRKWNHVISELKRIVKPGGYIELVEVVETGSNEFHPPKWDLLWSGVVKSMERRGIDINIASKFPKMFAEMDIDVVNQEVRSFPIGWDGKLGELQNINLISLFSSLKPLLSRTYGIAGEEYDLMVMEGLEECALTKTFYNSCSIVGRVVKE